MLSILDNTYPGYVRHCVTCGDPIEPKDPDNFTRPVGFNKAGATDCGKCVRGMKRTSN